MRTCVTSSATRLEGKIQETTCSSKAGSRSILVGLADSWSRHSRKLTAHGRSIISTGRRTLRVVLCGVLYENRRDTATFFSRRTDGDCESIRFCKCERPLRLRKDHCRDWHDAARDSVCLQDGKLKSSHLYIIIYNFNPEFSPRFFATRMSSRLTLVIFPPVYPEDVQDESTNAWIRTWSWMFLSFWSSDRNI